LRQGAAQPWLSHRNDQEDLMAKKVPTRKHERAAIEATGELSNKDYARALKNLHIELVKLQQWVVHKGLKVCIVFEGRDGAGKGGSI
jgi:polyphosphate kinase 2 (PPK2 family)